MCSDGAPAASINASFNNVNTQAISIIAGHSNGQCRIDFGFDVSNRYIMVVANSALPVIVTFTWDAVNNNLVYFWHHTIAGVGEDGLIMVMVY